MMSVAFMRTQAIKGRDKTKHSRLADEDERSGRAEEDGLALGEVPAEGVLKPRPLLRPEEFAVLPIRLRGAILVPAEM